jgi:hypothetical protein
LVLEVAAVDDDELVDDVVPAPPDSEELCLTAEDVGCLELLCCLLFSECADEAVVVPVEPGQHRRQVHHHLQQLLLIPICQTAIILPP